MSKDQRKQGRELLSAVTGWFLDPAADGFSGAKGRLRRLARSSAVVFMNFMEHRCLLRASALSFTTILSMVPLFALAFAVLKGLGVQNTLEPIILEHLTAGSGELVGRIISYINNTKMASLGAIGLAALVITVISLLGSIEDAFNEIWGVDENRSPYRRFSDYLSVVVSGPLLLLAATSMTTSLQSQSLVQWLISTAYFGDLVLFLFRIVPYFSVSLAFVCLYLFIPNTRVKIRSAMVGGIMAGIAWETAQWGYIHFQVGVAKYNAVYGTLAALPVFMVWIYTSWIIVLFGAVVVAAHQNRIALRPDTRLGGLSWAARESTSLAILLTVAGSFVRGERPRTLERIAGERHLPVSITRSLLANLVKGGYLVVAEGGRGYYPARDPENIDMAELLAGLKLQGVACPVSESDPVARIALEMIARMEEGGRGALRGLTLRDLALRIAEDAEPPQAGASPITPR